MQVVLSYGKNGLALNMPDDWDVTVIRKPEMPVLADLAGAVESALSSPVECRPLSDLAKGRKNACIAICDITRPVPNGVFLPQMIRQLIPWTIPVS